MRFAALTCAARIENLPRVAAYVASCADGAGAGPKKAGLSIAVEEAFVNICRHAYPDGSGEIVLICRTEERIFEVELKDKGIAFDPLSVPPARMQEGDIMDRPVGGLGVPLMRRFCDAVEYRREAGWNILRLAIRRAGEAPS